MFLLQLPPGECGRLLRSSLPPPGTHLCSCQLAFVRGDDKNMFGHSPDQHLVWSHHCHWAEFWLTSWLESRWIMIKDVFSSFRVFTLTQPNPTQPNSPCDPDIMTKRNHYLICLIDDDSVMTMTMKALEVTQIFLADRRANKRRCSKFKVLTDLKRMKRPTSTTSSVRESLPPPLAAKDTCAECRKVKPTIKPTTIAWYDCPHNLFILIATLSNIRI